jgi:hypothetical protein
MKGEIEKIWKNHTSDGRRYNVLQIGGERYSLWEEDYLDKLQEGQALEFDFRESGEFKNINRIYEPEAANGQPEIEPNEDLPPGYNGPQANDQKTRQIIRMRSLRSASQILGGSRIPAGERAEKTIEIAKKFEKYIDNEDLADQEDDQKP